ncbi:putative Ig domain-containing protein [Hyphomonas sp.]|uniref:putative Ig domain-containing protein n=1 Tax=Hyphomonas sp. TaxID=87 RepID=UPI00391DF260
MPAPTAQQLIDAGTDVTTLGTVINAPADHGGDGTVTTRRGGPVKTLAWYLAQLDTHRLAAAALVEDLDGQEAAIAAIAAALASGQPLDLIIDHLDDLIAASGIYPVALGEHDALEDEVITDPRVTVMHEDERYRPRVLPHTITLPFDPEDFYLMVSQGAASAFVLAELRRLATYHPPVAPDFGVNRSYAFEAGSSGTIVDLNTLVTDPDSPAENRSFEALGALPTGVTLTGAILARSAPPIQAPAAVTFRVTDESGLTDTVTITLHSYDPLSPPTTPPVWVALPVWNVTAGTGVGFLHARSFIIAGTTPVHALTITATGVPPGLSVSDGVLSGVPSAAGTYTITWTAIDAFGAEVEALQTVNVSAGAAPVWASIPAITLNLGQTLPPVRYGTYLSGAPFAVSALTLGVSGQPAGTALSSRELRGVPTATGTFTVTVTATNPSGVSSQINHTITVLPAPSGGGGGGGGGPGGGEFERFEPY